MKTKILECTMYKASVATLFNLASNSQMYLSKTFCLSPYFFIPCICKVVKLFWYDLAVKFVNNFQQFLQLSLSVFLVAKLFSSSFWKWKKKVFFNFSSSVANSDLWKHIWCIKFSSLSLHWLHEEVGFQRISKKWRQWCIQSCQKWPYPRIWEETQ